MGWPWIVLALGASPSQEELVEALRLNPQSAAEYMRVGHEFEQQGQYRAAVEALRGAVKLAPLDVRAHIEIGAVLYKAAARVEWAVVKDRPKLVPKPKRVDGDELDCWREPPGCFDLPGFGEEQVALAERTYSDKIMRDPHDTSAYMLLGRTLRNLSVTASVHALELAPQSPRAYLTLAHVLPAGGNLGLFKRALSIVPTEARVYIWFGSALKAVKYYGQANDAFGHATSLAPKDASAYLELASLRLHLNRSEEAVVAAARSLRLDRPAELEALSAESGPAGAWAARVATATAAEAAVAAAAAAGEAPRPQTTPSRATKQAMGQALAIVSAARLQQERAAEAVSYGRSALLLEPRSARAYRSLAHALADLGEALSAGDAFRSALALDSHDVESQFAYGALLKAAGPKRLKEAIHRFQLVMQMDETFPNAKAALRDSVELHRQLTSVKRPWVREALDLLMIVAFVGLLSYFLLGEDLLDAAAAGRRGRRAAGAASSLRGALMQQTERSPQG